MEKEKVNLVSNERRTYGLQSVAQTIMPLAKNVLGKKGFVEVDIITNWDKIVGQELADYSFPQSIDFKRGEKTGGALLIMVPSGAFALELQHREKVIISKINTYFGYNAVERLKIMQNNDLTLKLPDDDGMKKPQKTLVTKEEENYIKSLSEEISNPELQEMLQKLGCQVFNNNKGEKNKQ